MAPDRRRTSLLGRAGWAFARANWRYWTGIASVAHGELSRWRERAERIEEPELRELALAKLREEGFNAQVAAVVATGVRQRGRRAGVARALVALTVLYDFLDGLTESPALLRGADPVGDGLDLSRALSEAVAFTDTLEGNYLRRWGKGGDDGGYPLELVAAVRGELARLPACTGLVAVLRAGALRCAEAQVRAHAAETLGGEQALAWSEDAAGGTGMAPRDFLAGAASSVLALHVVIASCADDGFSVADGVALDRLYLSISVLPTLLDSVVDRGRDGADRGGFLRYYEDRFAVAGAVDTAVDEVLSRAEPLADGGQHLMILAGIVGYYTSHPGARGEFARPVVRAARRRLGPLMWGVLGVVYGWRAARALRRYAG